MTKPQLIIGNKNYSSWSLRPWLALRQAGFSFDEQVIPLYRRESKAALLRYSPAGKVPILLHGERRIWDSLAIMEYVAEIWPELGLWPEDRETRAMARCVSAEMHAGFEALREHMPMNLRAHLAGEGRHRLVELDIARISAIWRYCRQRFADRGPFLFGQFSIADAMYALVAARFRTYAVELDPVCQDFVDTVLGLPVFREWLAAANEEPWVITSYANPETSEPSV